MTHRLKLIGLSLIALTVAGCGSGSHPAATTKNATVATLEGQPITEADLRAETGAARSGDPATQAEIDRAAVARIIDRRLLAKAAVSQGLDKTPEYAAASRRATEILAATALAQKLGGQGIEPAPEQVKQFIASHPQAFADRKLFFLDRILLRQPAQPLQAAKDPKTLDELQATLDSHGISYSRTQSTVDSATAPPELVTRLTQFQPRTVFEVSNGQALSANMINEVRPAPLTGETADKIAANMIRNQDAQGAINRELITLHEAAKGKITYSAGYAPTPSPPPPAS